MKFYKIHTSLLLLLFLESTTTTTRKAKRTKTKINHSSKKTSLFQVTQALSILHTITFTKVFLVFTLLKLSFVIFTTQFPHL